MSKHNTERKRLYRLGLYKTDLRGKDLQAAIKKRVAAIEKHKQKKNYDINLVDDDLPQVS